MWSNTFKAIWLRVISPFFEGLLEWLTNEGPADTFAKSLLLIILILLFMGLLGIIVVGISDCMAGS